LRNAGDDRRPKEDIAALQSLHHVQHDQYFVSRPSPPLLPARRTGHASRLRLTAAPLGDLRKRSTTLIAPSSNVVQAR
jgi:hypothetical protein